jgi:hypothetical protein
MPTTSAVPTFRAALVAAIADATDVQVSHAWPGPETEAEGIFLGDLEAEGGISAIGPPRMRRNEVLRTEVIVQTFSAAATAQDAADAETRVYELFAVVENVMANDPATGGAKQWGHVIAHRLSLGRFGHGWAARIVATVQNNARLT